MCVDSVYTRLCSIWTSEPYNEEIVYLYSYYTVSTPMKTSLRECGPMEALVSVRVSEDDKAVLYNYCRHNGISMSDLIRQSLFRMGIIKL